MYAKFSLHTHTHTYVYVIGQTSFVLSKHTEIESIRDGSVHATVESLLLQTEPVSSGEKQAGNVVDSVTLQVLP